MGEVSLGGREGDGEGLSVCVWVGWLLGGVERVEYTPSLPLSP